VAREDQNGVILDIVVPERQNGAAVKRFFKRLLHGAGSPWGGRTLSSIGQSRSCPAPEVCMIADRGPRIAILVPISPSQILESLPAITSGETHGVPDSPRILSPIDVLINSAGITGEPNERAGNVDYVAWARVLDVNTMGPLRVIEAFVEYVARSGRKLVMTVTSGMGSLADNTSGGSIAYRSSKAAVNMVMRSAAIDLAPRGIACVLVSPGWVRTDMGGPQPPSRLRRA
jgi:NAD(P)-dependent dehydrogenase (short-subunit alcohol dehydrogenase family)